MGVGQCPFNPKPEAMAGSGMDRLLVAPAIASGLQLSDARVWLGLSAANPQKTTAWGPTPFDPSHVIVLRSARGTCVGLVVDGQREPALV